MLACNEIAGKMYIKLRFSWLKENDGLKYIEYGKENSEVIMMLHGGGLSWWNYRKEAELLCDEYHIILPDSERMS